MWTHQHPWLAAETHLAEGQFVVVMENVKKF
jgi:hypothetical protein